MTKEELGRVINVITTADGGCKYCVADLLDKLKEYFPEHSKEIKKMNIYLYYRSGIPAWEGQ